MTNKKIIKLYTAKEIARELQLDLELYKTNKLNISEQIAKKKRKYIRVLDVINLIYDDSIIDFEDLENYLISLLKEDKNV